MLGDSEGVPGWFVHPHPRINCPFARGVWGGIHGIIGLMDSHTSRPAKRWSHSHVSDARLLHTMSPCHAAVPDWSISIGCIQPVALWGSALCEVPLFHRGRAFFRLPHRGLDAFEEAGD